MKRIWLFRIGAIMAGIMPVVLLEIALRVSPLSQLVKQQDPRFGRNAQLFELGPHGYRTAPARQPFFPAQEFLHKKPADGFRIFCFGGSTVHGHPYQSDTAFPKWLEMELNSSGAGERFQAINCGGVSYASYRLAPLVKEVLNYE